MKIKLFCLILLSIAFLPSSIGYSPRKGLVEITQQYFFLQDLARINSLNILCEAFLLDSNEVRIYDKVNGNVIYTVQNNYEDEIIYSVQINNQMGDWIHVSLTARDTVYSGWIKNETRLGTYSKNYNDTLFVYKEPEEIHPVCSILEYFISPMIILDCKKDWVKVRISVDDLSCTGWVQQSMTCSNPYTTCP